MTHPTICAKTAGKRIKAVVHHTKVQDQANLTDAESRIMPIADGGFEQAYNAQAAVAVGSLLIVA